LSTLHGKTVQFIEEDGFDVAAKVEMTMKSDTESAICGSIAVGLTGFSNTISAIKPDMVIVLGDRYELWSVCIAATIHKIPIAHIHGGEVTFGLIDDPIRHSVTKMSAIHFAAIDLYAKRIIQMGEDPNNVHIVGAIGLDNIKATSLMTQEELSDLTGIDFAKCVALVTYHPVTLDQYDSSNKQIRELLEAVKDSQCIALVTMPNSDTSSSLIFKEIQQYVKRHPYKFTLVNNLGQRGYLSAMKYAKLMIGNSSSGIIESASFKLPVVNVGDRQSGRYKTENIIDTECNKSDISKAINNALSEEFRIKISHIKTPFGDGNAAKRIVDVLETIDFENKEMLLKKGFYDLDF